MDGGYYIQGALCPPWPRGLCTHSFVLDSTCTWFECVSMLVILLNCVTLGMYQPCDDMDCLSDRCKILQVRPPRPAPPASLSPAHPSCLLHPSTTMPRPPTMPRPTTSMSPPCPALQNRIPTTCPALSQLAVFFLTLTWSYSFPLVILSPLHLPIHLWASALVQAPIFSHLLLRVFPA